METNQVRYFLALCEEQSFTRAAKRCGVSQPSISNAIRRLEEELGGSLFHRTRSGTRLSHLGVALRPYLDQINQCTEGARCMATNLPIGDLVSTHTTIERSMRKTLYSASIAAGVLLVLGFVLLGHKPYAGNGLHLTANDTVNVAALEATIDVSALPRQDIPREAYQ